jgi:DNA mismatch repair protein MutS
VARRAIAEQPAALLHSYSERFTGSLLNSKSKRSLNNPLFQRHRNDRERVDLALPTISLMTPYEVSPNERTKPAAFAQWQADLNIGALADAMAQDRRYAPFIRDTLSTLLTDPAIISWRQQVLQDFLDNPDLAQTLQRVLPNFANLRYGSAQLGSRKRTLLIETSDRLAELELYIELVETLHGTLKNAKLNSEALTTLRDVLQVLIATPNFEQLKADLPELRRLLQAVRSLTIGINLDTELRPEGAILLGVNDQLYGEPLSLLDRLLGTRTELYDDSGIAPLHQFAANRELRVLDPFFQDVDKLMTSVAQPIARALTKYVRVSSRSLIALESEFAFFAAAATLISKLKSRGIPFCQPELAAADARLTEINGLVNIMLALKGDTLVKNDAAFNDIGRVAILTGPNSGGKTTYLRAVGLAHVLCQTGLLVPAAHAVISPVDDILTHFPALETQQGRLAEEAQRIREMFTRVTSHSLILLNETFSSTAAGEALYLAHDVLSACCAIGTRTIFATHLTTLASEMDSIEQTAEETGTCRSRPFSLIANIQQTASGETVPTYRITRGQPLGRSYAQEIAQRYGIQLNQLLGRSTERDIAQSSD